MLWIGFGIMLVAALAVILVPLSGAAGKISQLRVGVTAVLVILCSAIYWQVGTPGAVGELAADQPVDIEAMVASLSARLEREPGDVDGWKMLGRSYRVMGRFADAVTAFDRAATLEESSNGQTLAELGEAIFLADNSQLNGRAAELFERSLALVPGNPKSLFYSGLAAAERGDVSLAADRWEALLATSPPPDIEQTLRASIAEWRGTALPETAASNVALAVDIEPGGATSISDDASVFIIARDPARPTPPVAVARRKLSELPGRVTLTDRDAMLPGRPLSGLESVEIVVRASVTGQPIEQPGDWFGSAVVPADHKEPIAIALDEQVPGGNTDE